MNQESRSDPRLLCVQVPYGSEGNYGELAEAVQRGAAPRVSWRFDPGRVPHEKFTQGSLYFWMALTWGGLQSDQQVS